MPLSTCHTPVLVPSTLKVSSGPGASRRAHSPLFGLLLLVHVLLPLCSKAVSFEPLSVEALTRQAELVLQGTVLSKTIQRDPTGRIYTAVEVQVSEVWKGAVGVSPFLIVHGGGVLGDEQATVSGQVHYDVGEEVVAFLVRNARGEGVTLGLMQGKFHVWRDPRTGTRYAMNPFNGVGGPGPKQASFKTTAPAKPGLAALPLVELKNRVTEATR